MLVSATRSIPVRLLAFSHKISLGPVASLHTSFFPMSDKPITAYEASVDMKAQTQSLPGLDGDMAPHAEHSRLEYWDSNGKPYLKEYVGTNKLGGKKAIITGGDSVRFLCMILDESD